MKKIIAVFLFSLVIFSAEIGKALVVAQVFTGGRVQSITPLEYKDIVIGYVAELSRGFVLIPKNDLLPPIKLYSEKNSFDLSNPIIQDVVNELYVKTILLKEKPYIKKILDIKSGKLVWRRMISGELSEEYKSPLLKTKWDQGYPYNYYVPTINGQRAWAGCVATAFAQIMKFWNWPPRGEGSHSYSWRGQTLSANFDHPYNWDNMPSQIFPSSPFSKIDAVARLIYDVGIAFEMEYGLDGSGAYPSEALRAFPNNFKYSAGIAYKRRNDYSSGKEWFLRMKWERDLGRPFEFTICSPDVCHAVVVDGYKIKNGSNLVHINFGWSGYFDGYYGIDNINAGYNFTDLKNQDGIFNIFPRGKLYPPDSLKVIRHIDRGIFVFSYVDEIRMSKSPSVESNIVSYRIYSNKKGLVEKIWEGEWAPIVKVRTLDEDISYAVSVVDATGRESKLSPFISPQQE